MTKYVPISRDKHFGMGWRRPTGFGFAANEAVVPIVGVETAAATSSMPLTFIHREGSFRLACLLALSSNSNMFVAPDGRWVSGYIPAILRAYPFRLSAPAGRTEPILCIDENSNAITERVSDGEAFFNEDGSVSEALAKVVNFLSEIERSAAATNLAVAALDQAGLIVPWPIKVITDRGEQNVDGLYKIDEVVMNVLPTEAFEKLRATGALPIAYGQLFSMNRLSVFKTLAEVQAKLAPKPAAALPDTLDKLFDMGNTDVLKFD